MVIRVSDKKKNYSKVTKLLVKPFEKNIILYYQSLLQNNVYEDIPLIQNFILDYYTETNNKDMMIKILIDIKSFNDKDLTLKSSTLFTTSQS